jgi:hypothetical protein
MPMNSQHSQLLRPRHAMHRRKELKEDRDLNRPRYSARVTVADGPRGGVFRAREEAEPPGFHVGSEQPPLSGAEGQHRAVGVLRVPDHTCPDRCGP